MTDFNHCQTSPDKEINIDYYKSSPNEVEVWVELPGNGHWDGEVQGTFYLPVGVILKLAEAIKEQQKGRDKG